MVGVGAAAPVEDLAADVADGVDRAVLGEDLQVPVHGGEPDLLALLPEPGVDLLGAAEPGQAVQRQRNRLGLAGAADPGAAALGRPGRTRTGHPRTVAVAATSLCCSRWATRPATGAT